MLHVQDLSKDLFLLTVATARGMKIKISGEGCIVNSNGSVFVTRSRRALLLTLNFKAHDDCYSVECKAELWHRRLGYGSYSTVNKLIKDDCINGERMELGAVCDI